MGFYETRLSFILGMNSGTIRQRAYSWYRGDRTGAVLPCGLRTTAGDRQRADKQSGAAGLYFVRAGAVGTC